MRCWQNVQRYWNKETFLLSYTRCAKGADRRTLQTTRRTLQGGVTRDLPAADQSMVSGSSRSEVGAGKVGNLNHFTSPESKSVSCGQGKAVHLGGVHVDVPFASWLISWGDDGSNRIGCRTELHSEHTRGDMKGNSR
ncbi:hypothetical protein RRG08_049081 [Elysia crispata]|uniref:Uncharacterized protein n=1 Tax=Elysia crispata TaxID=231223 RepID=A0AAE1DUW5_9GAST|nr:hypothetical protein RRG08_049081 [Elysia crispata]